MKKYMIATVMLLCILHNTSGQPVSAPAPNLDIDGFKRGLSPQVALINRYGDYPVDLQNGLVDISIPLYTISTPSGLTMPLQLKFHASGLRSDEREGLLGIRWVLSGAGHVSRIIKGYADDFYPFNSQVSNQYYTPDFYTLFGTTGNKAQAGTSAPGNNSAFTANWGVGSFYYSFGAYKDTEYDIFSYSLPSGKSGKFILEDVNGVKTARLMPYEPLLVYVNRENITTGKFTNVTIIDEDGITYLFGEKRTPNTTRYTDSDENDWVTSWYLSSIISANKKDTIEIDYTRSGSRAEMRKKSLVVSDRFHENNTGMEHDIPPPGCSPYTSPLYLLLGELLLDPYNYFKEDSYYEYISQLPVYYIHSIRFRGGGQLIGNIDLNYNNEVNNSGSMQYLKEMNVKDGQGNLIRKINFVLKNNLSNNLKLLDKIEFKDTGNTLEKETYTFDYYDSFFVPTCKNLSDNSDWWGFYSETAGWFRNVNQFSILAFNGTSNTIVYKNIPGGDKQPRAESMKIGMIQKIHYPTGGSTEFEYEANSFGSGLRILKLKYTPEQGKTEVKRYAYGQYYVPGFLYPPGPGENIFLENETQGYSTISYCGVDDIEGIAKYIQRTYQNTFPGRYTDFHSNTISYNEVTEYIENSAGTNIGKTVYKYSHSQPDFSYYNKLDGLNIFTGYGSNYLHGYVSPTDFWKGNHLDSMIIFDNNNRKVKEYIYNYSTYNKGSVWDMPVYRYRYHLIALYNSNDYERDKKEVYLIHPNGDCSLCLEETFAIKHQQYTIGAEKLSKVTENTYQPDGTNISVLKEMTYDPQYFLLEEEKITNSDSKVTKTNYKYPFALVYVFDSPYNEMVSKNHLTPVIEKTIVNGSMTLETVFTDYQKWSSNGYYPSVIQYQPGGRTVNYHNYTDLGKPIYISKNNEAEKVVYLWGYHYRYPVAEIKNVSYTDVVNVLGQTAIDNLAVNTNPDIVALSAQLRTAFQNQPALVTCYAYKPLVGMTMVIDPRGVKTTYEYDGFGRLTVVRDHNGNAIESYDYHYKNP
ncbi:MAG: RHS repeat protein [Tannerella sp.]|jgi:YD repeat-containing protein|nr:RHS repeat protein [Tannerella sp.]